MLNLEPIRQRLFDLRVRGLGEWYPVYAAKRELTKEQICDDGDDMVKEIQRLRLENDRLRVEKARTCGECRNWRFKSEAARAFGVCDSPQVADYTKILIHGRPDLREEIKDYGRLETDERFYCMFWEAIGSERKE